MTIVIALMLVAAFCHALWNALIKHADDRIGAMTVMSVTEIVIVASLVFVVSPLPFAAWPILALSVIVHFCYRLCLLLAYRQGDFSQIYPLARGASPLIAAFFAYAFLGEALSARQTIGVLLICGGVVALSFGGKNRKQVMTALLVAVCISSYTVIDAAGARIGESPLPYIVWINLLESLGYLIFALAWRRRATFRLQRQSWQYGLVSGVLGLLAYALVIYALTLAQVGAVSALREISVIFGTLLGVYWLKEKQHAPRRIISAVAVALGVIFLVGNS